MKVFAISDLHLSSAVQKPMNIFGRVWDDHWGIIKRDWDERVGENDLVVLAGDTSWAMQLNDAIPDLNEIAARPGKKVLIRGNHDYWWASRKKLSAICPDSIYCLQNDAVKISDCVVFGSRGWTTPEPDAKQTEEDAHIYKHELLRFSLSLEAAKKLAQSDDRLIALIHYPPFNSRSEDSPFTRFFSEAGVAAVVYGHLHGGTSRCRDVTIKQGIPYYLTSCDLMEMHLKQIL